MKKITLKLTVLGIFIFSAFLIAAPVLAQGTYVFRSTVTGTGIRQTGQYSYEIVNPPTNFRDTDTVYVMTRIFKITNVDSFRFRHLLVGSNGYNKETLSPVYYPHRQWWQEIWYWYDCGRLQAGNYEIRSSVQIDGGSYQPLAGKRI